MRICACGCNASLDGLRADAVYASDSCRKRAERANSADKGRTRRPSRNGHGTRIYLTEREIELLQSAQAMFPTSAPPSDWELWRGIERKLALAKGRLR